MEISKPYQEAFSTGQYAKRSGLEGKYDNVRQLWEERVTQLFLRPYLEPLVAEKRKEAKGIRILDLGCGSGDGYELITKIPASRARLNEHQMNLISPDVLQLYLGFDISTALVEQGRSLHKNNGKVEISEGDFSQGLPQDVVGEIPYDLYFTTFGTLSHNEDEQNIKLLSDIANHSGAYALVVADWLGRYSYEWQGLWVRNLSQNRFMDYVISYIYSEDERQGKELEHFPLRLMSREEIEGVVRGANERAKAEIKIKRLFDRSIFVGRHMDTGDYNEHCQPLRRAVNSLFEVNVRTDLNSLLIDYHPKRGFDALNGFFAMLRIYWNALVQFTSQLLDSAAPQKEAVSGYLELPPHLPKAVEEAMQTVRRVVWLKDEDPRANIIEPQLGYALRGLEMSLQQGIGAAHSLVAILEIRR
jgi:SAM-dependent methyltransferase